MRGDGGPLNRFLDRRASRGVTPSLSSNLAVLQTGYWGVEGSHGINATGTGTTATEPVITALPHHPNKLRLALFG